MKLRILSFRFQIVTLVILLIFIAVIFFRNYFIESFQIYSTTSESLSLNEKSRELYDNYKTHLDTVTQDQFREDIEEIMSAENQKAIARHVFISEIQLYSKFILFFLLIIVIFLFFISINFITRPLNRLQNATVKLASGDLSVRVRESRFSPLNDLIVSFNNMTEELDTNRRKLVQAEKDSAWRDMARVLAHEIKNPLTPMRLSLERLENKYALKSDKFDEIFSTVTKVIHEEIDKLQNFSTEFSKFAKLPTAVMEHYDINEQIINICEAYQKDFDIKLILGENIPLFQADKIQIKQVLDNLIQNSINASKKKIKILITTYTTESKICISIKDNGKGIAERDKKEIFKPYFTKSKGGTGLGLTIVQRIIDVHDGSIDVQSKIGIGTTFILSFPIINPQENKHENINS